MAASQATQELTELTNSIEHQLAALQLQVDKLKICKTVLAEQHQKRYQDRGSQADAGPQINPLRHVKQMNHTQPFTYQHPSRKINWKKLHRLDVQAMAESGDAASIMELFEDVAYGDVESGSIYDLSEANMKQMIKLAQLQLQYMQYKLEEKIQAEQAVEDDSLAIAAGLSCLAAPSLGDIHRGLGALESDLKQLGNSRVDGLIEQVRVEERQAAKSAVLEAIQKSKQQVDLKYGVQVVSSTNTATAGQQPQQQQ